MPSIPLFRVLRCARTSFTAAAIILFVADSVQAEQAPQPGLWKVAAKFQLADGTARDQSRSLCFTPAMLSNLAGLAPSACKQTMHRNGFAFTGQIECRAPVGENNAKFELRVSFDTTQHYSGTIRTTGSIDGRAIAASVILEGQRLGECEK
jgi:hypothetical protein